jgi:AraC-like DNA-binding protein
MRYHGLSVSEAIRELAREAGIDSSPQHTTPRRLERTPADADLPPPTAWQHAAHAALIRAHHFLLSAQGDAPAARAWLHARGITDDLIRAHQLGYNDGFYTLSYQDADGKSIALAPGITIPIYAGGELWGIKIRRRVGDFAAALQRAVDQQRDGSPVDKYTWLRGSRTGIPFGADGIGSGQPVLIVEGEFDAMVAQAALSEVTVITGGSASTPLKAHIVERLKSASALYTCFDNDAAGRRAKPLQQLEALGSKALTLRGGAKDVTEYLQQGGDLSAWFTAATRQSLWWETLPPEVSDILHLRYKAHHDPCTKNSINTVRLLHKAESAELIDAQGFTVKELLAAARHVGIQTSRPTLERALSELDTLFCSKIVSIETSIPHNFEQKPHTGRPPTKYQLLPKQVVVEGLLGIARRSLAEKYCGTHHLARLGAEALVALMEGTQAEQVAQELSAITEGARERQQWSMAQVRERYRADMERLTRGLQGASISHLEPAWELFDYRAAKVRALVSRTEGQPITQKTLAQEAGCSVSYLPTLLKRAGIESTPHSATFEIRYGSNLGRQISQINYQHQCKVISLNAMRGEEVVGWCPANRADPEWVRQQRESGHRVVAHATTGNTYRIVCDEPPLPVPKPAKTPAAKPSSGEAGARRTVSKAQAPEAKRTPPHDYFKGHDPEWVFKQLALAVELVTGYRRHYSEEQLVFLDVDTGEIVCRVCDYRDLLRLLGVKALPVVGKQVCTPAG